MYSCQLRLCLRFLKGSSGSFPPGLNLWTSASVFSSTRVWSKSKAAKILLLTSGGEAITNCARKSSCFFQKQVQVNVQSFQRFRFSGFLSCRPAEISQTSETSEKVLKSVKSSEKTWRWPNQNKTQVRWKVAFRRETENFRVEAGENATLKPKQSNATFVFCKQITSSSGRREHAERRRRPEHPDPDEPDGCHRSAAGRWLSGDLPTAYSCPQKVFGSKLEEHASSRCIRSRRGTPARSRYLSLNLILLGAYYFKIATK